MLSYEQKRANDVRFKASCVRASIREVMGVIAAEWGTRRQIPLNIRLKSFPLPYDDHLDDVFPESEIPY